MVNKLNEAYIGIAKEAEIIKNKLNKIRSRSINKYPDNNLLFNTIKREQISLELFHHAVALAEKYMKKYYDNFRILPAERYFINEPLGIGGFYGEPQGGYFHLENIGFTSILNKKIVINSDLRTLELFRNFFHDCLHANTYKTYKLKLETSQPYRYQYGINFRDGNGLSYSSRKLTEEVPLKINLNVLMDGIIQIFVSRFINNKLKNIFIFKNLRNLEKEILSEITKCNYSRDLFNEPNAFYDNVLIPSKLFLSFWGGNHLSEKIMYSMLTGDLIKLKKMFDKRMKIENSWDIIFKRKEFREIAEN